MASPELHRECLKFRNSQEIDNKTKTKIRISLSKYYLRSNSRCTPFGLFAGCAVGDWSHHRKIIMRKETDRHTRLDMYYLCALAQELSTRKYIQKHLLFYTNNSTYTLGNEIRYIEYKYLSDQRIHQISAVEIAGNIEQVLEEARTGTTISRIKEMLTLPETDEDEIDGFIKEILDAQLLVSELEPAITGEEFILQILKTLKRVSLLENKTELVRIIHVLESACQMLTEIDNRAYNEPSAYDEIVTLLDELGVPIEEGKLFQTDLVKRVVSGGIPASIQESVLTAVKIMNQFSALTKTNSNLERFTTRFYDRYQDQEISLLEALDTESGIGYVETAVEEDMPLLQDILFPKTENDSTNYQWAGVEELLQQKLINYFKKGDGVVTLKDEDLTFMKNDWEDLPPSLHVLFRIIGKNNDKIFVESCGGSSGINLLSRFAHADKDIAAICNDIVKKEEEYNPDVAFAEIIHLPESRTGNILLHPAFREYEIPYLSKSSLPSTKQIPLQDLLISVRHGRIVLRSKKLNKRIIPRLSNAHNFTSSCLPVYQFLCELQTNGLKRKIAFSWGAIYRQHKILPRVEYKNVVLSPAIWKLSKEDFSEILEKEDLLSSFLNKYNIPQRVVLADGDNELFVNFHNSASIKVFKKAIRRRESIELKEFFDTGNIVQDEEANSYNNQVLAILLNKGKVYDDNNVSGVNTNLLKKGMFPFGTKWLYYKIYCGEKSADRILTDIIKPLVNNLIEEKVIDNFFFIRYTDPGLHLRIRLRLITVDSIGSVATKVYRELAPLFQSGHISNIQLDTYKQELSRYGSSSIGLSEELFFHNSISVLEMLSLIWGDEREHFRWLWAMRAIDELLGAFGYFLENKLKIMETLKDSFAREFKIDKNLKEQLNKKYRREKENIEQILNRPSGIQINSDIMTPLLNATKYIKKIADQFKALEKKGELEVSISSLLISHIHMLMNRVIISNAREHELVIYDFLFRYYKSETSKQLKIINTIH